MSTTAAHKPIFNRLVGLDEKEGAVIANTRLRIRLLQVMRPALVGAIVAGLWSLAVGTAVTEAIAEAGPTIYRLNPGSTFQRGCFPPCLCPIFERAEVRGTLLLAFTEFDGLFYTYAVTDVNWTVALGDREPRITGSGTYKVGGEFAIQQRLELDLQVDDAPVQHFDSGLIAGGGEFPDIAITVSIHGQYCFDTVLAVSASPVPAEQIHPYALLLESTFQRGCFPPCRCALGPRRPLSGPFALVDLQQGSPFTEFAVVNVDWQVSARGVDIPVRGFGTYRIGGEVAVLHQLRLDLRVGNGAPVHFDSGLVPGGGTFPAIDSLISIHGVYCFDTVIEVHAAPGAGETETLWPDVNVNTAAQSVGRSRQPYR